MQKIIHRGHSEGDCRLEYEGMLDSYSSGLRISRSLFLWSPGDSLMFTGYSSMGTAIISDDPFQSANYTFDFSYLVPPPVADFFVSDTTPYKNNAVLFSDSSTGNPTWWKWYFGDGDSSMIQNPVHIYSDTGKYTVTLIVSSQAGTDTLTKVDYIQVSELPVYKVYDIDGNPYDTIHIGNQIWLKQNLRTTRFNNGVSIPNITVNATWLSLTTPGYCWYNNNILKGNIYGALYNGYTMHDFNICPQGWHVPTDSDWTVLRDHLGGYLIAGGAMKDTGTTHWLSPNTLATNSSKFTALPGGVRRDLGGGFQNETYYAYFWSDRNMTSSQNSNFTALTYDTGLFLFSWCDKIQGLSIRCTSDTLVVATIPQPEFTVDDTTVFINDTVRFTDLSMHIPLSWKWYFGDGDSSSLKNPVHQYTTPGLYTVTLIATNSAGSGTLVKQNYIRVDPTLIYPVPDIDGNLYDTVHIGTQVWMKQNLRVSRFNNGSPIPEVTLASAWSGLTTPGRCWYNNDSASYAATYGSMYNWYAASNGNLCPPGWHVPSYNELNTLSLHLGGSNLAGGHLKEAGTAHWASPNTGATNSTGFTALPGGSRDYYTGAFSGMTTAGFLWTSTPSGVYAYLRGMNNFSANFNSSSSNNRKIGASVRCLADF